MPELVIRLVGSLAVVVGLLLLLARLTAGRFGGSGGSLVRVVHRQALTRTSSIAVVTVGPRVLVLGTTEHQVQLLTELDPEELDLPALEAEDPGSADHESVVQDGRRSLAPVRRTPAVTAVRAGEVGSGPLAGSALSAATWRQALAVATRRQRDAS